MHLRLSWGPTWIQSIPQISSFRDLQTIHCHKKEMLFLRNPPILPPFIFCTFQLNFKAERRCLPVSLGEKPRTANADGWSAELTCLGCPRWGRGCWRVSWHDNGRYVVQHGIFIFHVGFFFPMFVIFRYYNMT